MKSGLSIVIHDRDNRLYFKYNIESSQELQVLMVQSNRPALSVYPNPHIFPAFGHAFFEYPEMPAFKNKIFLLALS